MSTQPRMSAPIGRLRIRTSKAGKRRASGVGAWTPADPPIDVEVGEADEARDADERPRFYPFPLRERGRRDD